ncbi:MAG: cytidine deaminase, partial [Psychrilyobacter sp.]|uniref:deoxycytidylate deaminase n=1 Tax=Psychrilyobacter sp. TaxID=2586924 RepID=UPI003C754A67
MKKREDYLSWDEYFMGIAVLSGQRSKDPSTQVGACIINEDKKIVGAGYNGFPKGCSDDEFPWGRDGGFLETKY